MKKIFSWLIDKWLAGFLTASFFFMVKLYIDLPKDSTSNFFKFDWLSDILYAKISFYIVLLIICFLIIITRFEKAMVKSKYTSKKEIVPKAPQNNYSHYKSDIFGRGKSIWTWNYKWNSYKNTFQINDLKPSCPVCGTQMELETGYSYQLADCHKCRLEGKNYNFQLNESIFDVEKEIIRKLNNKEVPIK